MKEEDKLPLMMSDEERRWYIRDVLFSDNKQRIEENPEETQNKFDKLAKSAFRFFRGTASLYYRDYRNTDLEYPFVFSNGDVHPENFGIMPNKDNAPFFGLNDFDEAGFAPFTFDVKRGAVGFYLGAETNKLMEKYRSKIVQIFVESYIQGLELSDQKKNIEYRMDNSPTVIKNMLKQARTGRKKFLRKKIDLSTSRFLSTDKIIPYSSELDRFKSVIKDYVEKNDIANKDIDLIDVAIKKGSGTSSSGLERYFLLVKVPEHADYMILEMKETRSSVLLVAFPDQPHPHLSQAEKVVLAHDIHLVNGDPYYGWAEYNGKDFLIREKSPFKFKIDVRDLSYRNFKEYATICGIVLAQAHVRADKENMSTEKNIEGSILSSLYKNKFVTEMVQFAEVAAKRVERDYQLYKEDYKWGRYDLMKSDLKV